MSGPRGIQLSSAQVIASVLATLTGAIAASYLGVAGTLVGAAVGSVASTMGTEVYKHYLLRSQQGLRSAGQVLHNSAARTRTGNTMSHTGPGAASGGPHASPPGTAAHGGAGQDQVGRDQPGRDTAVWDRRQYGTPRDPRETEMIPGLGAQWGGTIGDGGTNGGSTNGGGFRGGASNGGASNGGASNGGGRTGDTASQHAQGSLTGEGPAGDDAGGGGLWGAVTSFFGSLTRRQWLTYGGIAGGFFLVVVAGITLFELTIGKPVSTAVWGGHSSGTSVGDTFSGHRSPQQKPATHPSSTPSATPTGSTPASPTPSAVTSSGAPTPSTSVAPSSPSTLPSSTPTTGRGGAARSATTGTPAP
jgi:hypothetical protein